MGSVGLMVFAATTACAQDYPAKTIRIITSTVGAGADFAARQIAQGISGPLGQPVVVENRQVSTVAAEAVAKAAPDGYVLLVSGGSVWLNTVTRKGLPYDVVTDFAPITIVERGVMMTAVHPSLPVRSVKDLIAFAKANPGRINYAASGLGGATHLSVAMLQSMSGIKLVGVQYKGGQLAISSVISGETQMMIADVLVVVPHMKSNRLRVLAVTSATPSAIAPDLPTMAAAGLPGYEWIAMTGVWAPAKTPPVIITRLNQEVVRTLTTPEIKQRFLATGLEIVANTPEQAAAAIKADIAKTIKTVNEAGLKIE